MSEYKTGILIVETMDESIEPGYYITDPAATTWKEAKLSGPYATAALALHEIHEFPVFEAAFEVVHMVMPHERPAREVFPC